MKRIAEYHASKLKVNGPGEYLEVIPGTDKYKQFLREALLCDDRDTLRRVQGNKEKPVHIIDGNHYPAYLKAQGESDLVIVVSRSQFRRWNRLADGREFDWQGKERKKPKHQGGWIEIATYSSYDQMRARVLKDQSQIKNINIHNDVD